jgi:hypothetical protein
VRSTLRGERAVPVMTEPPALKHEAGLCAVDYRRNAAKGPGRIRGEGRGG